MLNRLNQWAAANASGRNILLAFGTAIVSLLVMALVITPAFQAATAGLRPFDLNFGITAQQMYQDLPAYTDASRLLYLAFAAIDTIYPAAVAVFFMLFWTWLFAKAPGRMFSQLVSYGIYLVPSLYMLVDWSENAGFLFVIFSYPAQYPGIASIAGALKSTKPMVMNVQLLLTAIFVLAVIIRQVMQREQEPGDGENDAN
jgi:hypothetical protein